MKRPTTILVCAWLAAGSAVGCNGGMSDGGQSGTGIAAIRGNVVAIIGAEPNVADIRVSLATLGLMTRTDADGRFELRDTVSGPDELRFERERDGLFARADVVIPAGGLLDLQHIELNSDTGQARPARQQVELEGIVESLDCAGGTIGVISTDDDDPHTTAFAVEVASATIRHDGSILTCNDLRVGDRVQVHADTMDGSTLINAELELEDREDDPTDDDEDIENEEHEDALDCEDGTSRTGSCGSADE